MPRRDIYIINSYLILHNLFYLDLVDDFLIIIFLNNLFSLPHSLVIYFDLICLILNIAVFGCMVFWWENCNRRGAMFRSLTLNDDWPRYWQPLCDGNTSNGCHFNSLTRTFRAICWLLFFHFDCVLILISGLNFHLKEIKPVIVYLFYLEKVHFNILLILLISIHS